MIKKSKKSAVWEDIFVVSGKFIFILIALDVILSSLLFLFHVPVTKVNFFLAYFVTVLFSWKFMEYGNKNIIKGILTSTILIILTVLINFFIHEIAWDGNLYHKFATGILKLGWNPVYDNVYEYIELFKIPAERVCGTDIWVTCYPKASWIFDATIYSVTNNIESAKAFNLLISYATFGLVYNYFSGKLGRMQAVFISGIFTLIPAVFAQLFTYYVDGSLGNILTVSVIMLLSITDEEYSGNTKKQLFYLGLSIIMCSNLKFTGLILEGLFCFAFFIYWCVMIWKKGKEERRKKICKLFCYYIVVILIAVCVVGAGTYITNIRDYNNPLYPIFGSEILDGNYNLRSVGLEDSFPLQQILSMIFVKTSTDINKTYLEWKVPFTFSLSEFGAACHDTIRGGAGVFFSGILIIAIIMLIYLVLKYRKIYRKEFVRVGLVLIVSFILLAIVPAGGQIRYSPYIYYFTNFTIYLWMRCRQEQKRKINIGNGMICLIMLNAIIFAEYQVRGICESIDYTRKYEEMEQCGYVEIDTVLPGVVFNLMDHNIMYQYNISEELVDGKMKYLQLKYNLKGQL